MSYRKQISYLELQENGQRIRGAGYAKLESWEKEEILMVQLRGQGIVSGKEMLLYLQRESGEELLCEMTAERGTISCEKRIFRKADWEPTLGIRIPLERNFEIIGRFAGAAGAKKVPAPVTAIAPVTVGEIEGQGQGGNQPEQAKRPIQTEQQEAQNREMQRERVQEQGRQAREQTEKVAETVVTNEKMVSGSEARSSKKTATEHTLHMKDTKWEQLSSIYPHIHPFRDAREFLSVGPEDFVVLRERCYQMTHNSFLLHGYYNYRHLLLMRQEASGEVKYYIGVPGGTSLLPEALFNADSLRKAQDPVIFLRCHCAIECFNICHLRKRCILIHNANIDMIPVGLMEIPQDLLGVFRLSRQEQMAYDHPPLHQPGVGIHDRI